MTSQGVPWVAGRLVALARAIAMREAELAGKTWTRLTQAQRDNAVKDAEEWLKLLLRNEVLVGFHAEYRETENGGKPLADWKQPPR